MATDNLYVKFNALLGGLKTGISSAKSEVAKLNGTYKGAYGGWYTQIRKVNQAQVNLNKDLNRSSKLLGGLGRSFSVLNMALGIGSIYGLGHAMANSIQSSLDMIETQNLFNVSLGTMAVKADDAVQSLSDLYGLDVTNLQNSVGTYSLLARSMGMANEEAATLGLNTTRLATDLSSLMNVPIQQVMSDLRSGLVGQSETVYKYGIDVTEAGIKQEAMRQGITKSVRNMSQGEKMALRYAVMIRQTTLAQGDFTRTLESPANQLKILGERFTTLSRSIGSIFLPLLERVLPYLNAFVSILIDLADAIAAFFGYTPPATQNTVSALSDISENADDATDAIGGMGKALKNATLGMDELNVISEQTGGAGGAGVGGPSILDQIKLPEIPDFTKEVNNKIDEMKQKLKDAFQTFMDTFGAMSPILAGLTTAYLILLGVIGLFTLPASLLGIALFFSSLGSLPIIGPAMVAISDAFLGLAAGMETFALAVGSLGAGTIAVIIAGIALMAATIVDLWRKSEDFRSGWTTVWNNIANLFGSIWSKWIAPILQEIKNALLLVYEYGLKPLWSAWLYIWEQISGIITDVLNGVIFPILLGLVNFFGTYFVPIIKSIWPVFATVFNAILGIVTGVFFSIGNIFTGLRTTLNGVITFLKGVFTENWKLAFEGLAGIVKGVFSTLGGVLFTFFNIILGGWNAIVNSLNKVKIKIPDWVKYVFPELGGKEFSFNLTPVDLLKVPKLAMGGELTAGQMFIANEAGPELIGNIGNRTVVMNNDQITDKVSDGVYRAVKEAMSEQSDRALVVELDGEVIYRNQQKIATGRGASFGMGVFAR